MDIRVHDFQCQNPICEIGAFSETFHGFLNHYSRMTERLIDFVTILALETSCEASARIMQAMHVKISGDTVIRMLLKRYQTRSHIPCGSHIGVDDFALKKSIFMERLLLMRIPVYSDSLGSFRKNPFSLLNIPNCVIRYR